MIGRTLSHYQIREKIGSGGMGDVYLARDTELNRDVAFKVLPPELAENEERRARFKREAQAVAALNHPTSSPCTPSKRRTASTSSPWSSSEGRRSRSSSPGRDFRSGNSSRSRFRLPMPCPRRTRRGFFIGI